MGNSCTANTAIVPVSHFRDTGDSNAIDNWLSHLEITEKGRVIFANESVDRWTSVLGLTAENLKDIGLPLGDQICLLKAINELNKQPDIVKRFTNAPRISENRDTKTKNHSPITNAEIEILKGNLQAVLDDQKRRKIKLYFSLSGNDMSLEFNYILSKIVPKVRAYAAKFGIQLSIIDVRSMIYHTENDQNIDALCMDAIDDCFDTTAQEFPCFVILQGHKYGNHRRLPTFISTKNFQALAEAIEDKSFKDLFLKWYQRDRNSEQERYYLVPITLHFPKFKESPNARTQWWDIETKLYNGQ